MTDVQTHWWWLTAACFCAVASTLGAIFIGEVMGMTPCLLCWYQRIAMFPLAVILSIAIFTEDRRGAVYAIPFAIAGLSLAGYHSALIAGWIPQWWVPCGEGPSCARQALVILGNIQIPWLSLAAFAAISVFLLIYLHRTQK